MSESKTSALEVFKTFPEDINKTQVDEIIEIVEEIDVQKQQNCGFIKARMLYQIW